MNDAIGGTVRRCRGIAYIGGGSSSKGVVVVVHGVIIEYKLEPSLL